MAVHILPCTALLWQNLIKTGAVSEKEDLSPSFPLVIYNRSKPWNAVQDVADLLAPQAGRLLAYQPHQRYFFIDESRVPEEALHGSNIPILIDVRDWASLPLSFQEEISKTAIRLL